MGDFEAVRKDIAKLLHQPEYDDGSAGPVLVRLAWHVIFPLTTISSDDLQAFGRNLRRRNRYWWIEWSWHAI